MGDRGERLRRLATWLLVGCGALLVAATWAMRNVHPGFVWVQAFAEAALVGGLADWFAVTALFRHPLGVPIPHTAIIPRSKDRIGDALAAFIRDNFLGPRVVMARLERLDAAGMVAAWLRRPASDGRVRRTATELMTPLTQGPAAEIVARALRERAGAALREMRVAPLAGQMLGALLEAGRHRPVIDAAALWAGRTLDDQEGLVRTMVGERTNWLLRLAGLDERVADAIVAGLRRLLAEIAGDPQHPVREAADRALQNLAFDLQHMPETQAKVERMWSELLDNPAVGAWMDGLLGQARGGLADLMAGDTPGRLAVAVADTLDGDAALTGALNALARRGVAGAVARHGDSIVALVSDTIRAWDATTVTEKLEGAVGRDLQYIRLNGTLIGGLIGLVLHAVLAMV